MQHKQHLRHPALRHPHHPLLLRVFAVPATIKIHIGWPLGKSKFRELRDDAYGLSARLHVYRAHPLRRRESEHRYGLSFGFGFVYFRGYRRRFVDVEVFIFPFLDHAYLPFTTNYLLVFTGVDPVAYSFRLYQQPPLYDSFDTLELSYKPDTYTVMEQMLTIYTPTRTTKSSHIKWATLSTLETPAHLLVGHKIFV